MLTPELWNRPTEYRAGRFFEGGVDRTCAEPENAAADSADGADEADGADTAAADLEGSPLDEFMTGSFAGTLTPGCTAKVLNP